VDECVRLAGKLAYRSKGFINGVLRSIVREKANIKLPEKNEERLSVQYSFPLALTKHFISLYGPVRAEKIMAAFCEAPEMHVRVNTLKASVQEVRDALCAEGVAVSEGAFDDALILSGTDITALEVYKEGLITAQGAGSMTAVRALDAKKGMCILDMCAAPGGKSVYIAQRTGDECTLHAFDIHLHKIQLIEQTARRMGIKSIHATNADATVFMEQHKEKADCVLVDAPCSGLGIIGKKPDIKYVWSPEKEEELAALQLEILNTSKQYVKHGGTLVYSTCTIGTRENMGVLETFLKENPEFSLCDITDALPNGVSGEDAAKGYIQLLPDTDGTDGFFVSKMKRK